MTSLYDKFADESARKKWKSVNIRRSYHHKFSVLTFSDSETVDVERFLVSTFLLLLHFYVFNVIYFVNVFI